MTFVLLLILGWNLLCWAIAWWLVRKEAKRGVRTSMPDALFLVFAPAVLPALAYRRAKDWLVAIGNRTFGA